MIEFITEFGFCPGVTHALDVFATAKTNSKEVLLFKPLMHNERENEKLMSKNVSFLKGTPSKDSSILFPAHGHDRNDEIVYQHHKTFDALCPVLKSRYDFLLQHQKECRWFYIGKRNHQETIGFLSHFPFLTFLDIQALDACLFQKTDKTGVILQSTFEMEAQETAKDFFSKYTTLCYFIPLCPLYTKRANDAIAFLSAVDPTKSAFLVLGSKTSSNCNEMYRAIKEKCPRIEGMIINQIEDIDLETIRGKDIYLVSSTSISKENALKIKEDLVQLTSSK